MDGTNNDVNDLNREFLNTGLNGSSVRNDLLTNMNNFVSNPYYVGQNENPSTSLVNPILSGPNYLSWKRGMEIALGAKLKLGFVDGTLSCPSPTDPMFGSWTRCNLIVQSWLLNSVSPEISQSILYEETPAKMWMLLKVRYSQGSEPRIYEIQHAIHSLSQGILNVADYFSKLDSLWTELNLLSHIPRCTCGGNVGCSCGFVNAIIARDQRFFKMIFLMGLNDSYSATRGQILLMKPLPAIDEMFSMVIQEEKQRNVCIHSIPNEQLTVAAASTYHKANNSKGKQNLHCSFCNMKGHTRDTCYRLHGFPPGFKMRGKENYSPAPSYTRTVNQVSTLPINYGTPSHNNHGNQVFSERNMGYNNSYGKMNSGYSENSYGNGILPMPIQQTSTSQSLGQLHRGPSQLNMGQFSSSSRQSEASPLGSNAMSFSNLAYTGIAGPSNEEDDWQS